MYARTLHLLMVCALSLLPAVGVYAQYNYSFFPIHSAQLNPLEQRLAEADFCEITPAQLRIPNYHTECLPDESLPLEVVTPKKLGYILKKDVVKAFDLAETYPTPLQMKRFKESAEYQDYLKLLDYDVEELKKQLFYMVFDIERLSPRAQPNTLFRSRLVI